MVGLGTRCPGIAVVIPPLLPDLMNNRIIHCEELEMPPRNTHTPARMDEGAVLIPLCRVRELAVAVVDQDIPDRDKIIHTLIHEVPGEKMWEIKDVLCGTEVALVTPDDYVYGAVMDCFYAYLPHAKSMWFRFHRTAGRKPVNQIIWEWLTMTKGANRIP